MCLFINGSIYAYGGGTLVQTLEREARVLRSAQVVHRFDIEAPIEWLKISPDGKTVLIYSDRGTRIWRWREDVGLERFVEASNSRDIVACGFMVVDGSIVTIISRDHILTGLTSEDGNLFACTLRSPHSFAPRSFVQLPHNRLALTGAFFGDSSDVVITVNIPDLFRHSDAVQLAIQAKDPIWDRAIDIAVGPCGSGAAVVLRDPEDTEISEEDDDQGESRSDVENFAGVYIRELDSGLLVERHRYTGRAGSGAAITGTSERIVAQVVGGVDMIRRSTGEVQHMPGAFLDVWQSQLATFQGDVLTSIAPIDELGS